MTIPGKLRTFRLIPSALLFLFFSAFHSSCGSSGSSWDASGGIPSLAFYYTWYKTPDFSGYWWHWNSDGHNPEEIDGEGRRDIASAYYPALGPYDSSDPEVIGQHIKWGRKAGLKGWIISWWNWEDPGTTAVDVVVSELEEKGCPLSFTLYLETLPSWQFDQLVAEMEKILDVYGGSRCALKTEEGIFEVFVYFRTTFPGPGGISLWKDAARALEGRVRLWMDVDPLVEPLVSGTYPENIGFHFYNPWIILLLGGEEAVMQAYSSYTDVMESQERPFALTVLPGYDDRELYERPFRWHFDRNDGQFYSDLLQAARAEEPDYLLITSFNEWHEGTQIEPDDMYGDQYLELTR